MDESSRNSSGMRRIWRIIWPIFAAVMVCWAFILGVWVGQGKLATEDQVASLKTFLGSSNKTPARIIEKPDHEVTKNLTFYDGVTDKEKSSIPKPKPKKAHQKPVSDAKPEKKAQGQYTVQVASMTKPGQALSLVRKLKNTGLKAYIVKTKVKGVGLRYRVRIGPFQTLNQAQATVGRMKHKYNFAAFVTRKEK